MFASLAVLGTVLFAFSEYKRINGHAMRIAAAEGALAANPYIDALEQRLARAVLGEDGRWPSPDAVTRLVFQIDPATGETTADSGFPGWESLSQTAFILARTALQEGRAQISDPIGLGQGRVVVAVSPPQAVSGAAGEESETSYGILANVDGLLAGLSIAARSNDALLSIHRKDGRLWFSPTDSSIQQGLSAGVETRNDRTIPPSARAVDPPWHGQAERWRNGVGWLVAAHSGGESATVAWRALNAFEMVVTATLMQSTLISADYWLATGPVIFAALAMCIGFYLTARKTNAAMRDTRRHDLTLAALERSEQRLKDLVDSSSDWLWETDKDRRFSFVSGAIDQIIGLSPEFFAGKRIEDIADTSYAPDDVTRALGALDKGWPLRETVLRINRGSAEPLYIRLSGRPRFDRAGEMVGYRGTARDVTSERRAEAAAQAAQAHLISAINSSSDGFSLWDSEDRLVAFNARFENFFFATDRGALVVGRHFEEIVKRYADAAMKNKTPEQQQAFLRERLDLHRNAKGSYLHNLKDGRWILSSDRRTPEGYTVSVNRDITELKRREMQLEHALSEISKTQTKLVEAKEQSELANRTKSEFLAVMGHELRAPLNAVIGFSEVMDREMFGPLGHETYKEYAGDILSSARHLLSLIDDLLDLSKAEAGRLTLDEDLVDLKDVARSSVSMVRRRAEDGGLRLVVDLAETLSPAVADERKIKQILLNLLTNAIKFTDEGGEVRLSAHPTERGALFEVSDTGVGIKPEEIEAVMTPFGQVDNEHNRKHKGTGLGVPLTKRLVDLHDGDFSIDSAPGKGTRVRFTLPKHRFDAAETELATGTES